MKAKVWVAVAAALVLWSAASSAQITFTPPALLNSNAVPDTGDDERPQVTTDGAGTWIAVWDSYRNFGTDADILFARSTNNGQTWSTIAAINTNASSDNADDIRPVLATDGIGNWICLWESTSPVGGSGSDLDILYTRSSDNGVTWAAPALLNSNGTTDSGIDEMPVIATDGIGNWVAVWDSNANISGSGFDYDVFVSRSTNNGATWTAAAPLNNNAATDGGADIRSHVITDGAGVWMAVWGSTSGIGGGGTDSDIIWARSTDNGATWTAAAPVNTNSATDSGADLRPGVAADGIGNWVVVWNSNSNIGGSGSDNDIRVARSSNNGTTWTAPALLNSNGTTDSGTDEYVRVNTDGLGNWLTVWNGPANFGGSGTDYDIWISQSTNNGATWSTMTRMNTTANTDFWYDLVPQVTPDGNGNWIGTWESNGDIDGNTTPDYDIVLTRFTLGSLGLSATSVVPATTGPTNATSVAFTVGFSDSVINFNNAADLVFNHSGTANSGVTISGGPQNYTVNVTGITGTGSFTMAVSTTSDVRTAGGTLLTSSVTSAAVAIDNTAPGVTLSSAAGDPVTGAIAVTATLTESSANFGAGDISTTNASISGFSGSGANYSFTLTPLATGAFNATVNAATFTDVAGNNNTVSNTLSRTADLSGPAITLSTAAGDPVTGAITVNAALTQSTVNFAATDITTVNATVDGFSGAGTSYSFTLTPVANGLFSATVPAGTFTNAGNVGNSASNTLSRTANLPSAPPGSEPTTAVVVNPDQNSDIGDDERPMLATDSLGNWVMVWDVNLALNGNAGSDMDILVTRSSDNGASWSSPQLLNTNGMTDSGTDIRPMVTTNGTGMWIAVWNSDENIGGSGGDNDVFFTRSTDNGATWSAPALLNTNGTVDGGSDEMVRVAADANGNWVATWLSSSDFGGNGNEFDVAVSRSSDNGATWSPPAVLNSNGLVDGATETRADVVTDGNGMWIALWASDENLDGQSAFDYDILYARSTNNGATWSASARLNTNATSDFGGDFRPAIATDRNGNWVASWHSFGSFGDDLDILVARSSDNGATWSDPALLNQGGGADGGDDDNVRLATDESGNWIAVWESSANIAGTGSDWDVFLSRSTNNGQTWGTPGLLNSHGATDDRFDLVPVIGTDRSGAWVTAWETSYTFDDTAGFDFDIAVSRFTIITSLRALTVVPVTASPTNASTVNFTVTFNNDAVNFNNAADVVINHTGTANTGVTITGGPRVYNVAVTGVSGNGSFTLAASTTSDVRSAIGNVPLTQSATSAAVTIDTIAPTITLASAAAATVNAGITVTATLSESSANFVAADINTTNATVSNFAGGGTNYSFTLTPVASGAFNASVPASRFTDTAGNNNTVSNTLSRTADLTPPTATLSTSAAATVNTFITINVVLSETSTNFVAGDITAVNGTVSNFTGSGTSYSFRLTPTATGTFSAQVGAGAFTDAVGNGNTASAVLSRTADLTAPTALISSTALDPVAGTITVTVVLSESSTNFTSGDVTRTNCTLSNFSGSGTNYSFSLNPSNSSGTYGAVIAAGTFSDAIGNLNTVSNTFQRTVDEVSPSVTFSTTAPSVVNGPITVTAVLTESSTNFVAGDLTLSNASVSNFTGSGTNYSFTLTPTINNGTFSVRVVSNVFTDFAGNGNNSSSTLSREADLTRPTPTLSSSAATTVNTFITITVSLSQTSTNFTAADITTVNGTVSNFSGSGTSYSFRLNPTASGTFSARILENVFNDAAGNGNNASNTISRTADLTAPTIALVNTTGSPTNSFITVSVTLSESSTNFTSADITTSNATVSNFGGSGTSYSFRLNPVVTGTFTGQVQAGRFTDAVGNNNTASNLITAVRN